MSQKSLLFGRYSLFLAVSPFVYPQIASSLAKTFSEVSIAKLACSVSALFKTVHGCYYSEQVALKGCLLV